MLMILFDSDCNFHTIRHYLDQGHFLDICPGFRQSSNKVVIFRKSKAPRFIIRPFFNDSSIEPTKSHGYFLVQLFTNESTDDCALASAHMALSVLVIWFNA
jgi:hypothetical protein